MGLVHKLLKHKDLERRKLTMDLTKSNKVCKNLTLTKATEGDTEISDLVLVPKLATEDNQFTTEHIMQLCQFLAESSKRNKTNYMDKLGSPSRCKHHTKSQRERDALQQQNQQQLQIKNFPSQPTSPRSSVLKSKFSVSFNSRETLRSFSALSKEQIQSSLGKRDVLLKIRHQILERRRQRQVRDEQFGVWRPW